MAAPKISPLALLAECFGMALFIFMATGSAVGTAPDPDELLGGTITYNKAAAVLLTATAFGFSITVLAYALGPRSGAHFNPAVTLGLVLAGDTTVLQGLGNVAMQLAGAVLGSALVLGMYPDSSAGANELASAKGDSGMAFLAEAVATFCLVLVVLECCCNRSRRVIDGGIIEGAPIAIGLAVFVAHLTLIPYTSCSINPARSFGPALLTGTWPKEYWVFVIGPLVGGAAAAGAHRGYELLARKRPGPAPQPKLDLGGAASPPRPPPGRAGGNVVV